MEWSKYVLSVMVGGCLLVLYGKKGTGRNKWLFGAGTGTSLMAMENNQGLTVAPFHIALKKRRLTRLFFIGKRMAAGQEKRKSFPRIFALCQT